VRPSIVIDGGYLEGALLFKKCADFFIAHADHTPAVHWPASVIIFDT
jgi:hypothetical protein